ncbi:MAG: carbohydrate porin [Candidatus Omnitrophica bacterium]|nr:carbohydrate porin [Candidatus Omnitrophota bacterium]
MQDEIKEQDKVITKCEHAIQEATISPQGISQISEGIEIGFGATGLVQGIVNSANGMQGDATDATWTADLELTKEFENCGLAYAHIEMGQGSGLDEDEVTFFSSINRDAGDTSARLEVTELYYEAILLGERLLITAGKLDPTVYLDDNEIANDETSQFLSTAFRNATTVEFPDNNLGGRMGVQLINGLYLNIGMLEDDGDFEDIGDGLFTFAQLAYTPQFIKRPGTYRIYGWHDTSAHAALKDSGMSKKHNFGVGLSMDQELFDSVIGFGRFGWTDPAVSSIEYAWSSGVQVNGDLWDRKKDYLGIAVGQNIPGDGLKKSGSTNHKEGQLELYYNYQIYEHLAISPLFQVIWNPNGVAHEDIGASDSTVTLLGLRSQLSF